MRLNPSVTDVARNFAGYTDCVAVRGERFVLMRGNRAVAELGPVPVGRSLGELPSLLASLPHPEDADADAFAQDLVRAREPIAAHGLTMATADLREFECVPGLAVHAGA